MTDTLKQKLKLLAEARKSGLKMHPDVDKSVRFVHKMTGEVSKRFGVSRARAEKLIERAADYNIRNKWEMFMVIQKVLLTNEERYKFQQRRNK